MRGRNVLVVAVCLLVAGGVLAQAKMSSKAAKPVIWQSGDMKWTDLDANGAPGVKIADLWGDHTKGAYGAITKFPAGFSAPLHTHTNTMRI
ncbi:MAG TPA: DUF4437 domain-containing protein, partial [Thermoanaerobaculia bacterium]|nr:DUF4437 domain-containing protein [Thermoanaerobaculia bacterium]